MVEKSRSADSAGEPFVAITRVFDAPRELVFKAWIVPEHLLRWHAPRGCLLTIRSIDVRPGGAFVYGIRSPDGYECGCRGTYREIVEPERLVYTLCRADEFGNVVEPATVGMDPAWPKETVVTVTFADLGGKTQLTLHQTVSESLAKRTGAHPGWVQMLDRLAEALA